jgi:cellulose 1,4-beta-cellobiosidase
MTAIMVVLIGGLYTYSAFFIHSGTSSSSAQAAASPKAADATRSPVSPDSAAAPGNTPSPSWLCGQTGWPEKAVDAGAYIVQNDEWNSTAPECITTDGDAQFTVASSSINLPTTGDPGGYPSIYSGCSAGVCSVGNKLPVQVSHLPSGMITSSWSTVQPPAGAYDVAYDIWFNHTPATSGTPDGGELMIWLAHRGGSGVAPSGAPVGHVTLGGHSYTVWSGRSGAGGGGPKFRLITYVMDRPATSVRNLDISGVAADAARRGYLGGGSYLVNIQAGFELWRGGTGLETKSFALDIRP